MKHLFLLVLTVVFSIGLVFEIEAQVTINLEDFQREATFIDSLYSDRSGMVIPPTEGPAQEWDYSGLGKDRYILIDYMDAQMDERFPEALNYWRDDLFFLGLPLENYEYETVNDSGWYALGRRIVETAFPLGSLTGSMGDSIRFLDTAYLYDTRLANLEFPLSYGDQWSQNRNEISPFSLTIQGFGLNETLGASTSVFTRTREVVGYGTVILPGANGTPTPPIEVLLIKSVGMLIGSVFLNGVPAPAALLQPFGITQGTVRQEIGYLMYTPGFSKPVMNIGLTADYQVVFAAYRPHAAEMITSIRETSQHTTSFPNPIAAGQILTIQTEVPLISGFIRLIDTGGKMLDQLPFAAAGVTNQFQVQLPQNLPVGLYFYEVQDKQAKRIGYGKLHVQ